MSAEIFPQTGFCSIFGNNRGIFHKYYLNIFQLFLHKLINKIYLLTALVGKTVDEKIYSEASYIWFLIYKKKNSTTWKKKYPISIT